MKIKTKIIIIVTEDQETLVMLRILIQHKVEHQLIQRQENNGVSFKYDLKSERETA